MTDKLVDFLSEIDKDETLKQNYFKDPKGTAEEFGLEADDVDIIAQNNVAAMVQRTDANGGDNKSIDIFR